MAMIILTNLICANHRWTSISFVNATYDTKDDYFYENSIDSFLGKVNSNIEKRIMERELTIDECLATLNIKIFQKNKTPGNDGLTVEFYLAFWPIIGKCLSEKKNKDKRFLKYWRPITLINVDVKIASKAIA